MPIRPPASGDGRKQATKNHVVLLHDLDKSKNTTVHMPTERLVKVLLGKNIQPLKPVHIARAIRHEECCVLSHESTPIPPYDAADDNAPTRPGAVTSRPPRARAPRNNKRLAVKRRNVSPSGTDDDARARTRTTQSLATTRPPAIARSTQHQAEGASIATRGCTVVLPVLSMAGCTAARGPTR